MRAGRISRRANGPPPPAGLFMISALVSYGGGRRKSDGCRQPRCVSPAARNANANHPATILGHLGRMLPSVCHLKLEPCSGVLICSPQRRRRPLLVCACSSSALSHQNAAAGPQSSAQVDGAPGRSLRVAATAAALMSSGQRRICALLNSRAPMCRLGAARSPTRPRPRVFAPTRLCCVAGHLLAPPGSARNALIFQLAAALVWCRWAVAPFELAGSQSGARKSAPASAIRPPPIGRHRSVPAPSKSISGRRVAPHRAERVRQMRPTTAVARQGPPAAAPQLPDCELDTPTPPKRPPPTSSGVSDSSRWSPSIRIAGGEPWAALARRGRGHN
jgi:hypothetical protein